MASTELLLKLITEFAKDGEISDIEKMIIKEKASELGIDDSSLEVLIKMELTKLPLSKRVDNSEHDIRKESVSHEESSGNANDKFIVPEILPQQVMIDDISYLSREVFGCNIVPELYEKFKFYYDKQNENSRRELEKMAKSSRGLYQDGNNILRLEIGMKDSGGLYINPRIIAEEFYRKQALDFDDVEFVKCLDFPNLLIKTKSNYHNFNLSEFINSADSESDVEFKKFEIKCFFDEKFLGEWWGTPEYEKEKLSKNKERKLKEQELEENRERARD